MDLLETSVFNYGDLLRRLRWLLPRQVEQYFMGHDQTRIFQTSVSLAATYFAESEELR
jgi:hypothetical protein